MCQQYYLPCRHITCTNFVKELHRERCPQPQGPECKVTYQKSKDWSCHPGGSHYCAACEEMGPEEWARRQAVIKGDKAAVKRALYKRLRDEEKERLKNGQGAEGFEVKKPAPKKGAPPCKPKEEPVRDPNHEWYYGLSAEPEESAKLFSTPPPTSRAPRNPIPTFRKPLTSSGTESSSDAESSSSSSEEG